MAVGFGLSMRCEIIGGSREVILAVEELDIHVGVHTREIS